MMIRSAAIWLCAALALAGCAPEGPQKAKVLSDTVDFGEMQRHQTAEHVFLIENVGGTALRLTHVEDRTPWTESSLLSTPVKPRRKGGVLTRFHAACQEGQVADRIILQTDDPSAPVIALFVRATLPRMTSLDRSAIYLGRVKAGDTKVFAVRVTNHSDEPLRVGEPKVRRAGLALAAPLVAEIPPGQTRALTLALRIGEGRGSYLNAMDLTFQGAECSSQATVVMSGRYTVEP